MWFLATLDTPLVSWLRTRLGSLVPPAMAVPAVIMAFMGPEFYVAEMGRFPFVEAWRFSPKYEALLASPFVLGSLFGLIVALSAMRRASTNTARSHAKAYAVAFGTHDAIYILGLGISAAWPQLYHGTPAGNAVIFSFQGVAAFSFGLLLARGILHTQLFDLKQVKRSVK
ncbi:MAG: hypothetical protein R3185_04510 [Candidatus Thermoplasmatota archaeon]|nr:hypothetical protein [Candidatus Thermoplasmatota archaeon]